jgi:hypothetical protein
MLLVRDDAAIRAHRQHDVVEYREFRQQEMKLEDEAELGATSGWR